MKDSASSLYANDHTEPLHVSQYVWLELQNGDFTKKGYQVKKCITYESSMDYRSATHLTYVAPDGYGGTRCCYIPTKDINPRHPLVQESIDRYIYHVVFNINPTDLLNPTDMVSPTDFPNPTDLINCTVLYNPTSYISLTHL